MIPYRFITVLGRRDSLRNYAYVLLGVPLGYLYQMGLAAGLAVAAALAVFVVGIPIFAGMLTGARAISDWERRMANALLHARIPEPQARRDTGTGWWAWTIGTFSDARSWWAVAWLGIRATVGTLGTIPHVVLGSLIVGCFRAPFVDGALQWSDSQGPHSQAGWASAWAPLVGVVLLVLLGHLMNLTARAFRYLARVTLGPHLAEQMADVRERANRLARQARLARELHDSVGHTLTLGVVTAAAARQVMGSDPAFATGAMAEIERVNRRALEDLDCALGALRADAGGLGGGADEDLANLLDSLRNTGLPVVGRVDVTAAGLPAEVRHEVYRIVQESCTNVLRHAGQVSTWVTLTAADGQLEVEVRNAAGPPEIGTIASGRPGTGLRGMAERVAALGGTMDAGRQDDGGYRVACRLPLEPAGR